MSAARVDYARHGMQNYANAINDHADRLDEMTARLESQAKRLAKLEEPLAPKPQEAPQPDPKPWGKRTLEAIREEKRWAVSIISDRTCNLIAEAEAAMKPAWRPMATAPRDGRWVFLRIRNRTAPHQVPARVAYADSGAWGTGRDPLVGDVGFDGWLPIPGEGDA